MNDSGMWSAEIIVTTEDVSHLLSQDKIISAIEDQKQRACTVWQGNGEPVWLWFYWYIQIKYPYEIK